MTGDNPGRSAKHWHDHAIVWAAIAAALGAAAAAAMSGWQAYLTRQNNIVSQRAFVYVDSPQLAVTLDAKDGVTKNLLFSTALVNSGNTATKNLEFYVRCAPSLESLPEPWVLLYREKITAVPQIIAPHQTVRANCTFPLTHIQQIKEGKARGYLMGEIIFRDRLDDSALHRTQFSWEIMDVNIFEQPRNPATPNVDVPPNVFVNLQSRGQHNCSDEDCPK